MLTGYTLVLLTCIRGTYSKAHALYPLIQSLFITIQLSGNFYANLFKDSVDAAQQLGGNLSTVVSEITNLHHPFLKSSLPTTLQDMLINSLSHVR